MLLMFMCANLDPEKFRNVRVWLQVDGWTEVQKDLNERPYSQWFTVIFIFLGHFIFTNLFVGIIIMVSNLHELGDYSRIVREQFNSW